ncbi:MAG: HNH endonuclease [Mycobacterium sp.]|nr:HNH endonuclease [Mycobacterium sp.]
MTRRTLLWLALTAVLSVVVAAQVIAQQTRFGGEHGGAAGIPTVAPGTDVLAGVRLVPSRIRGHDYRRTSFGAAWDDDNSAPGGRNGCDTRNEILDRDLTDKTYVTTKRCVNAIATGTLRDPYTNAFIAFQRGNQTGAAVQIDHIVPLAFAWDMGARDWDADKRKRFANDPANLLAVAGKANQDKGDLPPGEWMPPNSAFRCAYAVQFIEVLRGYQLPVDAASARELRRAAANCPDS